MELRYTRRDLDPAAKAFYARLAAGEFCVGRCAACGATCFPVREFCRACGEARWDLVGHPGDGTLYAFTTQERALRFAAPAVIALVELSGGVGRAFGVVDAPFDELRIGQPLVLHPVTVEDDWVLPGWRPA